MKTFVYFLLFCCCLVSGTYVHIPGVHVLSSCSTPKKLSVANQYDYTSANSLLYVENDFVFNVEDEDEEHENEKRSSDTRDDLTALLSCFANSFTSFERIRNYSTQTYTDNSPLYIAQRVLRI